jgi:hypothetical protein
MNTETTHITCPCRRCGGNIGFPIFLYFSLRRIEKTLAQLERNTRNR